jgi:hypothetical protein
MDAALLSERSARVVGFLYTVKGIKKLKPVSLFNFTCLGIWPGRCFLTIAAQSAKDGVA